MPMLGEVYVDGRHSHRRLQHFHDPRRQRGIVGVGNRVPMRTIVAAEADHRIGGSHHGRRRRATLSSSFPRGPESLMSRSVEIAHQNRESAHVPVGVRDGLMQAVVSRTRFGGPVNDRESPGDAIGSPPPGPACAS